MKIPSFSYSYIKDLKLHQNTTLLYPSAENGFDSKDDGYLAKVEKFHTFPIVESP